MTHPAVQLLRAGLIGLALLSAGRAEEKPPPVESSEGQWVFSLLPKAFQKNPLVDQTVITEMTDAGRRLPPPTADNPAYYVVYPGGFRVVGQGAIDRKVPTATDLEACLQHALATNHYLPAAPGHPPTLMILYHWGAHTNLDQGSPEVEGSGFADRQNQILLSRAALVGGNKFAAELRRALEKQEVQDLVDDAARPRGRR